MRRELPDIVRLAEMWKKLGASTQVRDSAAETEHQGRPGSRSRLHHGSFAKLRAQPRIVPEVFEVGGTSCLHCFRGNGGRSNRGRGGPMFGNQRLAGNVANLLAKEAGQRTAIDD